MAKVSARIREKSSSWKKKTSWYYRFISVVVFASKPQLNRLSLNDSEKAIVNAFEDELFYNKWIGLLLIEKHDSKEVNDNTVWMVKVSSTKSQ